MAALIVVDLETTGLEPEDAAIVDLAAVAVREGRILDQFSTLVWPGRRFLQPRHREVLARVSGIDPVALLDEGVPNTKRAMLLFMEWLDGNGYGPFTSYNVGFDQKFLRADPWRCSAEWMPCVMEVCTMEMGEAGLLQRHWSGKWRWPRLGAACAHFGVEFTETHRALADARAAAELAIKLGMGGEG